MNSFPSTERIKSKLVLEKVYNEGLVLKSYPLKIKYLELDFKVGSNLQIVISVPKRIVKKAIARNRIRRQLKEIYRMNKAALLAHYSDQKQGLALFLIYTGKEKYSFEHLEKKLKELISKLEENL